MLAVGALAVNATLFFGSSGFRAAYREGAEDAEKNKVLHNKLSDIRPIEITNSVVTPRVSTGGPVRTCLWIPAKSMLGMTDFGNGANAVSQSSCGECNPPIE
jgi:hypothetical protein